MKNLLLFSLPLCLFLAACDDDTVTNTDGGVDMTANIDMANCMSNGFPCAPTLGTQIDRLGRPAINTALTDPLYDHEDPTAVAAHKAKQDIYNAAASPAGWSTLSIGGSTVPALFKIALGVYDSLNGVCGDQALSTTTTGDMSSIDHGTLAAVLTDDQLYVDSDVKTDVDAGTTTCSYLDLEVGVITNTTATMCGGRQPNDQVIDTTYSVVAGTFPTTVVSDGVGVPEGNSTPTFPFLTAAL